jgi:hypothetical protein
LLVEVVVVLRQEVRQAEAVLEQVACLRDMQVLLLALLTPLPLVLEALPEQRPYPHHKEPMALILSLVL